MKKALPAPPQSILQVSLGEVAARIKRKIFGSKTTPGQRLELMPPEGRLKVLGDGEKKFEPQTVEDLMHPDPQKLRPVPARQVQLPPKGDSKENLAAGPVVKEALPEPFKQLFYSSVGLALEDGMKWVQLNHKVGPIDDITTRKFMEHLSVDMKLLLHAYLVERPRNQIGCLRPISKGMPVSVEATDGKRRITQAKGLFRAGIDPLFTKWGCNKKSVATRKTRLDVYEVVDHANFHSMFTRLPCSMDEYSMTMSQIILFVRDNPGWLQKTGGNTWFLCRAVGEYFMIRVVRQPVEIFEICITRFSENMTVLGGHRDRLVLRDPYNPKKPAKPAKKPAMQTKLKLGRVAKR